MAKKAASTTKLVVKTSKLQEMVSRSIKGAGNNKILPITQMMAIRLSNNVLTLITTDATNYLYILEDKVEGADFYAVVPVETFSKLIARLTCDTISMELGDSSLKVSGNGDYSIPLQFDDDGAMVKYPDPIEGVTFDPEETVDIKGSTIATILNTLKPALAVTLENPCYTGYYVGDKVVATDTYLINLFDVDMFHAKKLVSPEVMNLLAVMTAETIHVDFKDDVIVYGSPDCMIYSRELEGIEDYAYDAIIEYTTAKFGSMCKLPKSSLLQLLDRLTLFVTEYDKGGIYMTFTKDGIRIFSKAANGTELIAYTESKNFKPFTCCIDVRMLTKQVKAQTGDVVEMYYGIDNAIKMIDGKITQIVALLEDERISESDAE